MAKKEDINKNFEQLKKQMIEKKKMAENTNVDNFTNKNVDNFINVNTNMEPAKKINTNENDSLISVGKIKIKKVEKLEEPKRITYYLRPETIKKIDKFSKACGMGKSEFVQKLLEEVLNNLEIEKWITDEG